MQSGTDENTPAGEWYFQMFGDPVYGVSNQILSAFSGSGGCTEVELEWNAMMAALQIEVEHGFGVVSNIWPFFYAHWKMQVFSSPVACYYHFGVLMANTTNCFRPNQVAQYFDCQPPNIYNYFHN